MTASVVHKVEGQFLSNNAKDEKEPHQIAFGHIPAFYSCVHDIQSASYHSAQAYWPAASSILIGTLPHYIYSALQIKPNFWPGMKQNRVSLR